MHTLATTLGNNLPTANSRLSDAFGKRYDLGSDRCVPNKALKNQYLNLSPGADAVQFYHSIQGDRVADALL